MLGATWAVVALTRSSVMLGPMCTKTCPNCSVLDALRPSLAPIGLGWAQVGRRSACIHSYHTPQPPKTILDRNNSPFHEPAHNLLPTISWGCGRCSSRSDLNKITFHVLKQYRHSQSAAHSWSRFFRPPISFALLSRPQRKPYPCPGHHVSQW